MQRMRRRLLRKLQKYKRKEKNKKKIEDSECSPDERLNCFSHNNGILSFYKCIPK